MSDFEALRRNPFRANLELAKQSLALFTWGNASEIDRARSLIAIKPSGAPYHAMKAEDLPIVDRHGKVVDGAFRPSPDLATQRACIAILSRLVAQGHAHTQTLLDKHHHRKHGPGAYYGQTGR